MPALIRPDDRWKAAVSLVESGEWNDNRIQSARLLANLTACASYVLDSAIAQVDVDLITFAQEPHEDTAEQLALLRSLPAGGIGVDIVLDLLKKLILAQLKDPSIMDRAASWVATALRAG